MARKAVQIAINGGRGKPGSWSRLLSAAERRGNITPRHASVARRAVGIGDDGAHDPREMVEAEARFCLELAKYYLDVIGYDLHPVGGARTLREILREYGLEKHPAWSPPRKFDQGWITYWYSGGLIDVAITCPRCKGPVLVEALEVPPPAIYAEPASETWTYGGVSWECPNCQFEFDVNSTNSVGGWDLEIEWSPTEPLDWKGLPPPTPDPREFPTPMPRSMEFCYRELLDFEDEDDEQPIPKGGPS